MTAELQSYDADYRQSARSDSGTPFLTRRQRAELAAGTIGLKTIVGPIRALPLPAARLVGRGLGELLYRVLGRYRRVALKNLNLVYGAETTEAERARMARAVFRHFAEAAAEFLKLPRLSGAEVEALAVVEGEENLKRALEMGKGVLLITGHIGAWEFLARWVTMRGYALNVVARDARDPNATKLMTEVREGSGAKVLYRGSSARAILQAFKRNEMVALLPDQNAADVFVPFFGFPTGTVDGPAVLHLKTQAPLLFAWCVRTPENRFHITFEPPEVLAPTGDREADIARTMTLVNARLEARVRAHPTQWLWLHDRWKASPGVFPDGAANAVELKTPVGRSNPKPSPPDPLSRAAGEGENGGGE